MIGPLRQFWSDDFDMDLLAVFPTVRELLGATADVEVWTLGDTTFGRLNHPTVWNTHGAYLWLSKPELERDERGWVNVGGCVTDASVVSCTWLEWLRDQWPHSFNFVLLPIGGYFQNCWNERFTAIMSHRRGWNGLYEPSTIEEDYQHVWIWLQTVNRRFASNVEGFRLASKEKHPYFAAGSVPGLNAPDFHWSGF